MPADVSWYKPGRVIYDRILGDVTPQEVIASDQAMTQYLRDSRESSANAPTPMSGQVHVIINLTAGAKVPARLNLLSNVTFAREPNLGWIVVVGPSSFLRFTASVVTQITHARLRVVATLAEARAFLAEMDGSLTDLPPMEPPDEQ